MTDRPQIARLALAIELEDGQTIRVYSAEVSGTVTLETDYPHQTFIDYPGRKFPTGPPRTTITIEGIHAYLIQHDDPNATKAIEQTREEIAQ